MSEKLGYLNEQTTELEGDFEKMREARERAKQQLEARFNEILRKIQNSKDFITSQGNFFFSLTNDRLAHQPESNCILT